MKPNFLLGCGIALGVLVAAILVGSWFLIVGPTRRVLGDIEIVAGLDSLNTRVENQSPFVPPPDGALTVLQLERFVRVQEMMSCRLHDDMDDLDARARRFRGLDEDTGVSPAGFRQAIGALEGIGPLMTWAKRLQICALNAEGFSREEYRWVRTEFYRALGLSGAGIYLEDVVKRFLAEERITKPPPDTRPIPLANKDLAAPYGEEVDCWFPFFVFGL